MIERYSYKRMKELWSQKERFERMLKVELTVLEGWCKHGLFGEDTLRKIKDAASLKMEKIKELEEEMHHDVGAFLWSLEEDLGEEGRWLHYGLTSYDVVDTALSLILVDAAQLIIEGLKELEEVLRRRAEEHKYTFCIGRTHGVWAEPTTFGLKMLVWCAETKRNIERMERAKESIRYAKVSGAVGNYANIPPQIEDYVCKTLGLKIERPSTQIVQRDRHAEYVSTLGIIASSIEKFSTEIRNLSRDEIGEVQEFFSAEQMGSTAMPHKRNPILSERLTGLARIVRSLSLASMENVALWHERDITHSAPERILLPTSTILVDYMVRKFKEVMEHLIINKEKMQKNIEDSKGIVFSQRILLEFIRKGKGRREAYEITKRLCNESREKGMHLKEILKKEKLDTLFDLDELFNMDYYKKWVDFIFENIDF